MTKKMASYFSPQEQYYFNEGRYFKSYSKLGAHPQSTGTHFAVWAPNAKQVHVVGDFNQWKENQSPLSPVGTTGLWSGWVSQALQGQKYKYSIHSRINNYQIHKADPYAFYSEVSSHTASIIWNLNFSWGDEAWMKKRSQTQSLSQAISIYEMHLGSWKRKKSDNSFLNYRELAESLPEYLKLHGYTHVEFMPVMEHPFYGSWGYQITGYFAPTSRYGCPQDFMYLVNTLHQHNIGVFLDWVPSHFPSDAHGLGFFDGSHLYEHEDPRKGFHEDWKSLIFNYGRNEVKNFLISNALFWLDVYHIDGLRVDAVSSMLYLDYSRKPGEWVPNRYGGRESLEALAFLKELNEVVYQYFPDVHMIAEESTAWPMVSKPTYLGGLGFGMKWDMGWMHDTLEYFRQDPIYRKYHHNQLTFRLMYAFSENFLLSLSHDEVVYEKGSLYQKMPGDPWQKMANLRSLYAYMYAQPGKKLLFMGGELAQTGEWNHEEDLSWELLSNPSHQGIQKLIQDLNQLYRMESILYETDFSLQGFQWLDHQDVEQSVLSFFRTKQDQWILVVLNATPVPRPTYLLGVPKKGSWRCLLNTDDKTYGGSGHFYFSTVLTQNQAQHHFSQSVSLTLPPLAVVFLKWEGDSHVHL